MKRNKKKKNYLFNDIFRMTVKKNNNNFTVDCFF